MNEKEKVLTHLDIPYSYELAKRMEAYRCNPELGYRSAGSKAEFLTGEMLKKEMEEIGLSGVTKDEITVDGWEFRKAVLYVLDENGKKREIRLGAYQTNCVTDGAEEYPLVYVGKGTELDYKDIDVKNKLVLVDINQRDEWWINFPVYQAHLKGAKALIAVQQGGYGEIDEDALNAQDIAGPADAPAFSISRRDAQWLKEQLDNQQSRELWVTLEADSRVMPECKTYNITGQIEGKHKDRLIVLSAHYDSYFEGFQDDNTAVAMMFGIAKALIDARIQPDNTILICAMAAEELQEEYPERKLIVIDSLCACLGEGLLVYKAVQLKCAGKSLEEVAAWVEENKLHIMHNVTIDDLFHLHRGGRVSKASAIVGTMIQIKPIIHMDDHGELKVIGKERGRKKALTHIVDMAVKQSEGWDNDIVMITHGDCKEDAEFVARQVEKKMGVHNILINCIGTVIGSHTGPGVVAVFCMGNKR